MLVIVLSVRDNNVACYRVVFAELLFYQHRTVDKVFHIDTRIIGYTFQNFFFYNCTNSSPTT